MTDLREELARADCYATCKDFDCEKERRCLAKSPGRPQSPRAVRVDALLPIIARVRAEERERCAKVLDNWPTPDLYRDQGAAAIRSLKDKSNAEH